MKHLIFFLFMVGTIIPASAQDLTPAQVPSLVLNAFQTKYSTAKDVEWEQEGDLFKCEFEVGKLDHDVWIDKSGNIKKHKEEISAKDLPAAVVQKLKNDFKDYAIDDADRIETDGKIIFEVDLDSSTGDREVILASDGTVVQGNN